MTEPSRWTNHLDFSSFIRRKLDELTEERMYYVHMHRLEPSDAYREELGRHRDICRQPYNHTRYWLTERRETRSEVSSMTALRSELPDLE